MDKLIIQSNLSRFWDNFKTWAAGIFVPKTRKINTKPLSSNISLTGQNIEMDYTNAEYEWTDPAPSVASDIKYQKDEHLPLAAGADNPMTGTLSIKKSGTAKIVNMNKESINFYDKNKSFIGDAVLQGDDNGVRFRSSFFSANPPANYASFYVDASSYNNLHTTNTNFSTGSRRVSTSASAGFTFKRTGQGGFRAKFLMVDDSNFTKEVSSQDITANNKYYLPNGSGTLMSTETTSIKGNCSEDTTGYFTFNNIYKVGPFVCLRITYCDTAGTVLNATSSGMVPSEYCPKHTIALTPKATNNNIVSSCSMSTAGKFTVRVSTKNTKGFEFYTIYYIG